MIIKSSTIQHVLLSLRSLSSMLRVQKPVMPKVRIFHWNSSFTVCCLYNVTPHPGGSCTQTSVYDSSRQSKRPQTDKIAVFPHTRFPPATQMFVEMISQFNDNCLHKERKYQFSFVFIVKCWKPWKKNWFSGSQKNSFCKSFVLLGSSAGEATFTGPEWKSTNERRRFGRYSQLIGTFAAGLWLIYLHRYTCSRSCWFSLVSKAL